MNNVELLEHIEGKKFSKKIQTRLINSYHHHNGMNKISYYISILDSMIEESNQRNIVSKMFLKYFTYKIIKVTHMSKIVIFKNDDFYDLHKDKLWKLNTFPKSLELYNLCSNHLISKYLSIEDYKKIHEEIVTYF